MSSFPKFDADAALRAIQTRTPAKVAKPAKVAPEITNFSSISDFSSPRPEPDESNGTTPEDRYAWSDELVRDLHRWLSVHDLHVWRAARIWEVIAPHLQRLEILLADYDRHGQPGDRKAAVFAASAVAAAAARAAREWKESRR